MFAVLVMSPVGYWTVRGIRRIRGRRRLAALAPPALEPGEGSMGPEVGVARQALELRARLKEPLMEVEDYLAALPLLDVELHLSRALRFRTSWGLRMRDRYEESIGEAFGAAARWLEEIESLPESTRAELVRLGASARPVEVIVEAHEARGDLVRNYGDGDLVRETRDTLHELADAYGRFAETVLRPGASPYR